MCIYLYLGIYRDKNIIQVSPSYKRKHHRAVESQNMLGWKGL